MEHGTWDVEQTKIGVGRGRLYAHANVKRRMFRRREKLFSTQTKEEKTLVHCGTGTLLQTRAQAEVLWGIERGNRSEGKGKSSV